VYEGASGATAEGWPTRPHRRRVYSKDISRLMHFRAVALGLGARWTQVDAAPGDARRVCGAGTKLAVELLQEFQERRRRSRCGG